MTKEPVFNLYSYTLQDVAGFTDNVLAYADTITTSIFNNEGIFVSVENTLAIESAVVLNLWGMVVHQLYQTVQSC